MLKEWRWKIRGYIPYTNWWLVWRALDKTAFSIMDMGCGTGKPMQFINRHKRFWTVGIDAFGPSVEACRRGKTHDEVRQQDLRGLLEPPNSIDVVICLQTLEHFTREEGEILLRQMMSIASGQVIITTDIGEFTQGVTPDGNVHQEHKYLWGIDKLRDMGFKVYGIGLRGWGGEGGYSQKVPEPFRWIIGTGLQVLLGRIMYSHPQWANSVLCVRNIE